MNAFSTGLTTEQTLAGNLDNLIAILSSCVAKGCCISIYMVFLLVFAVCCFNNKHSLVLSQLFLEHLDMLPALSTSLDTRHTIKMLAIVKQWQDGSNCHTSNIDKYLLLMLFKLGLDIAVFYLCFRKIHTSFLSMCRVSIILADMGMVVCMAAMWFLGPDRSLKPLCFLLAYASVVYGALPLPVLCLGLLDSCYETSWICKMLRNLGLTFLVWILVFIYAFASVKPELTELDYVIGIRALVCPVEESELINYFILMLFTTVVVAMIPFWSRIPQWVKEADRLSELREEQENQKSDFFFTSTHGMQTESCEENYQYETSGPRPPLWFSITLCFGVFWMPYLTVTVICMALGFGVPAYITVNLLWLECINSLLEGVTFWVQSKTQGPYSCPPENICLWHVYWHLSKGTQQQLPVAVFNPTKEKRITLFYV